MRKHFDFDPLTGLKQTFIYDESVDEKNFIITTGQDATPIVERNRAEFNKAPSRVGSKEDFIKVASIPLVVFEDLRRKGITRDPVAMKRWLNDPDNRAFRTRPGAV